MHRITNSLTPQMASVAANGQMRQDGLRVHVYRQIFHIYRKVGQTIYMVSQPTSIISRREQLKLVLLPTQVKKTIPTVLDILVSNQTQMNGKKAVLEIGTEHNLQNKTKVAVQVMIVSGKMT